MTQPEQTPDREALRWEADAFLEVERLRAERDALAGQVEDERAARQTAGDAADRFRDVLSEALGYEDENPGDDTLVTELRRHFGKAGPEPTRWRDFLTGARAALDQIEAMPDPPIITGDEDPRLSTPEPRTPENGEKP